MNPDPDPLLKGKKDGNCNITACQRPEAKYRHRDSGKYYCEECAYEIEHFAVCFDKESLFPSLNFEGRLDSKEVKPNIRW